MMYVNITDVSFSIKFKASASLLCKVQLTFRKLQKNEPITVHYSKLFIYCLSSENCV